MSVNHLINKMQGIDEELFPASVSKDLGVKNQIAYNWS